MIGLIQRVKQASVNVNEQCIGKIDQGILLLLGVEKGDTVEIANKLAKRVAQYRIFSDENGKMNLNIQQISGEILVVSQFTLVADTSKGNRPGFSRGASPEIGKQRYQDFIQALKALSLPVETGEFGADMQVSLVNDGPVTFNLQVSG